MRPAKVLLSPLWPTRRHVSWHGPHGTCTQHIHIPTEHTHPNTHTPTWHTYPNTATHPNTHIPHTAHLLQHTHTPVHRLQHGSHTPAWQMYLTMAHVPQHTHTSMFMYPTRHTKLICKMKAFLLWFQVFKDISVHSLAYHSANSTTSWPLMTKNKDFTKLVQNTHLANNQGQQTAKTTEESDFQMYATLYVCMLHHMYVCYITHMCTTSHVCMLHYNIKNVLGKGTHTYL